MYEREMKIRNMVGLAPPGSLGTILLLNGGTANVRNSTTQVFTKSQGPVNGKSSVLGVNDSLSNSTSTLNLKGMLRGSRNTNVKQIPNTNSSENVLSSQNYPNGNIAGNQLRLDQVPLGEQLHTPFNARELLWKTALIL